MHSCCLERQTASASIPLCLDLVLLLSPGGIACRGHTERIDFPDWRRCLAAEPPFQYLLEPHRPEDTSSRGGIERTGFQTHRHAHTTRLLHPFVLVSGETFPERTVTVRPLSRQSVGTISPPFHHLAARQGHPGTPCPSDMRSWQRPCPTTAPTFLPLLFFPPT